MIEDYLKKREARGQECAISMKALIFAFAASERAIKRMVAKERAAGALICSTTVNGGGYYLPATVDEVREQRDRMGKGIKARAIVLRPFRRFMKEVEKGKGVKA